MGGLAQDLRYALRMLRTTPVVTAVALVALALGIGANTAIFSVLDAVVLHPLPFPGMDRLVMVQCTNPARGVSREQMSPGAFVDLREENRVFESVGAYSWWDVNLTGVDEPERLQGFLVSPGFFTALGVGPSLGRTFRADEEEPGKDAVVVLSERLWRTRYGADPKILGKTVTLSGVPHVAIGVMPAAFTYPPGEPDLWVPLTIERDKLARGSHALKVVARLTPGVGRDLAREDVHRIAADLGKRHPDSDGGWDFGVAPLLDDVVRYSRPALLGLLGAVGFVLLIACANVANLLLAKAAGRRKEIAVRVSLGASRARIFRQLMTESVLLSLAGGTLGVLVALWGIEAIRAALPGDILRFVPGWQSIRLDGRMLAFTLALSTATGLLFGIVPALAGSRPDPGETLKEAGRSLAGASRPRLRAALVVVELSLAMVLLVGAALSLRGFRTLLDENLVFRSDHVLAAEIMLPDAGYGERARVVSFYRATLDRVAALPGVETAGAVSSLPMSGSWQDRTFTIEGRTPAPNERPKADLATVSAGYLRTLGIPVTEGRDFAVSDDERAEPVAIVSEKMARRFWPGESPLGRRIKLGPPDSKRAWHTVVGVVADIRRFGLELEGVPTFYLPYPQEPQLGMTLVVRTSLDPAELAAPLRAAVLAVSPDQPVYNVRTMERVVSSAVAGPRFTMGLMGTLAMVALLLATLGVYAVMANSTSERTHEIGVRMALGAAGPDVLRMVLRQGARLLAIGLLVGLAGSVGVARALAGAMFWVQPERGGTFAVIALLLAGVTLSATLVPAIRATRVDPQEALRHD